MGQPYLVTHSHITQTTRVALNIMSHRCCNSGIGPVALGQHEECFVDHGLPLAMGAVQGYQGAVRSMQCAKPHEEAIPGGPVKTARDNARLEADQWAAGQL